ncbi:MAG: quinolinate synthase NadA [Planctomycetes bacterium]|nr:quinolinate synthase NadA [Planctomycetota bacterium]
MMTADALYDKLRRVKLGGSTCLYTPEKCEEMAPLINEIVTLKHEKNAVILAHSYVSPEIVEGVADFVGDSYGLSKDAMKTDADIIVFAAVRFMGETAKILNPTKQVLIPSELNGCSLADSITAADVRGERKLFPDHTFVCYINTSAEVKAECDVCVTSSNINDIIERLPTDKVYFVPDRLMGLNLREEMDRRGVHKDIQLWNGTCYVHEEYDPDMIRYLRAEHEGLKVLSHPECSPGVLHLSDFVGSTSQLLDYMKTDDSPAYLMLTECGLTARLQIEMPEKEFVGSCSMCRYMKANNLADIKRVLVEPQPQDIVTLDPEVMKRARACIDAMFRYAEAPSLS